MTAHVVRRRRQAARSSGLGVANNIGTVLTGGLAPMLATALPLWFDHSVTGVVVFIALMSGLTAGTVVLAKETRHVEDPGRWPASPAPQQCPAPDTA
ncbi:hypothetical protein [Streptomyces sp. RTd22]|uniref:hypothetical protein n=1 Tax=Streptomyces sp. RTd22 TaxID=1841249 RepID=UPI000ABC18E4|nr:hypothetical protein [Streptomyces sp. RTd22]